MEANDFVSSIKESEIKEGSMKPVRIKGRPILLVRQGGEIFGVSNLCPHMGCKLEGGILRGYSLMCPCHGWKFDVRNGQYEEIKEIALATYQCKIQNGKVYVKLTDKI
jgi:3-phenylpropionate/trans-cinnamate dioxygenase ferredoxin subunit